MNRKFDVLRFIYQYMADEAFPPTLREIADACDMSMTMVVKYLDQLEDGHYLERVRRDGRRSPGRNIRLPGVEYYFASVPDEVWRGMKPGAREG